ncbi:MAG: arsenate reductase/protein-tyrosine-phosphatase family protein, partial [Gammaproteobacteria bacterium]
AICPAEYRERLHLFLSFAPELGIDEVPDPYYGGADGFERVFSMVEEAAAGFLRDLRRRHGLKAERSSVP